MIDPGEFLPPYYISQLEDSIIISGSFNFGDVCFIDAWELEVDDGEVSSYRQLFTIQYLVDHELKIIGFTKDKQPIVEASFLQQFHQSLQVFNPSFQSFQNVGVKANHGSFFVGQCKESLMLVNEQSMMDIWAILWNPCLIKFYGIEVPFMLNRPTLEKIVWGFDVRPDTFPTILNISSWLYGDGPLHVLMYTLSSDTLTVLGNDCLPCLGNFIHYENQYICAWLLEVEAAVVTSWRVLFVIPSQNIAKLLGFTMDDDPIVEFFSGQEMVHTLQVYDRSSQQFPNVGIEGDSRSFFIGPYKESLILLNV
ncbi:hypothetical protein Tco_1351230 [Tanacetum coccineum]